MDRQYTVTWVSRNQERLAKLETQVNKVIRRMSRYSASLPKEGAACFTAFEQLSQKAWDIVIEATEEDLGLKQEAIKIIKPFIDDNTLVLSSSSSILPSEIGTNIIGMHFFYPVALTNFVELIFAKNTPSALKQRTTDLANSLNLAHISQNEHRAFAANRLLLPLQNEVMLSLVNGIKAEIVEECSKSKLLPIGQLTLMDSVGFLTIHKSAENYARRSKDPHAFDALLSGLQELEAKGKSGVKNQDGLLTGRPLPWTETSINNIDIAQLKHTFNETFMQTCAQFEKDEIMSRLEIELVLANVFQAQTTFAKAVKEWVQ